MTHASLRRRPAFAGSMLSIVYLLSTGLTAGQFGKLFGGDKGPDYQTFKDPAGRFELEYPTKDWRLLPSGGSLALFVSKDGPTLAIDQQRLGAALTPAEVDAMSDVEVDRLKDQQPKAADFKPTMLETKAGRGVLIRFSRAGAGSETGVQYSIPVGQDLFRLNGVIAEKQVAKFEPIIMHMIQSFKAPATPAGAKN